MPAIVTKNYLIRILATLGRFVLDELVMLICKHFAGRFSKHAKLNNI